MAHGLVPQSELEQLHAHGVEAVSELFALHRPKLLRMIAFRLDSRILRKVDIEDVLQDVSIEAVRRIDQFLANPGVPFYVWLRQIANQLLIDLHRRYLGARMRDVSKEVDLFWGGFADGNGRSLAEQLADSLTTPSQCAVRDEAVAGVKAVLEMLEPIDREVLVLRHLEELSNNEVAEVLGIDRFAASKRYLRALARLRAMLGEE
jgi:RNA polymerase sigma-70 factor, ECF subfamily